VDTKNSAKLNNKAGAEHVQKNRSLPEGVDPSKDVLKRFASVDGDADRLVYYYVEQSGKFQLLDGDKIMSLACGVLKDLVKEARLQLETGVVQTAYANGAATDYISKSLSVEVTCVPTGVKYLHHAAAEFDIGAYFEANGHGTVLFQPEALLEISKKSGKAVDRLLAFSRLINQAVGDAISDLLLVEACLAHKKWDLEKWNSIYSDLPSYQSKVAVPDRTLIKTTDAERRTVSPAGLQEALDEVVKRVSRGRAFVRPSGTEDVVRVYAEAETESSAKELGLAVEQVVKKYCV
jgi:phosphoacetylglucosamine mutase